jgi:hypothetical protein
MGFKPLIRGHKSCTKGGRSVGPRRSGSPPFVQCIRPTGWFILVYSIQETKLRNWASDRQ